MKNLFSYFSWVSLAGTVVFLLLMLFAPGFAKSGEAMMLTAVFVALFAAFDKYVMKDIDTIQELKKGNVSYALFLVAIALVFIAVAIIVG